MVKHSRLAALITLDPSDHIVMLYALGMPGTTYLFLEEAPLALIVVPSNSAIEI